MQNQRVYICLMSNAIHNKIHIKYFTNDHKRDNKDPCTCADNVDFHFMIWLTRYVAIWSFKYEFIVQKALVLWYFIVRYL